jgi:hypothetical protein
MVGNATILHFAFQPAIYAAFVKNVDNSCCSPEDYYVYTLEGTEQLKLWPGDSFVAILCKNTTFHNISQKECDLDYILDSHSENILVKVYHAVNCHRNALISICEGQAMQSLCYSGSHVIIEPRYIVEKYIWNQIAQQQQQQQLIKIQDYVDVEKNNDSNSNNDDDNDLVSQFAWLDI